MLLPLETNGERVAEPPHVRNVVVLGLCQNGKTTFINECLGLQGSTTAAGAVGNGMERCTLAPTVFDLHPPGQPTQLLAVNDLGQVLEHHILPRVGFWSEIRARILGSAEEQNKWYREIWGLLQRLPETEYKADMRCHGPITTSKGTKGELKGFDQLVAECSGLGGVEASLAETSSGATCRNQDVEEKVDVHVSKSSDHGTEKSDHGTEPVSIKMLDTPGLEDTKGEDDEHVMKVMEAVLDIGSLSAIVVVCKCGLPITPTWQKHIRRYWKLFPMMQSQWIVVHTHSDPFAISARNRRDKSSYEEACEKRRQVVGDAIKEATGDENAQAAHLFVECDSERSEVLKAVFAEQLNTFCCWVASFKVVPIEELHYEKGRDIQEIDNMWLSSLDAETKTIASTLNTVENQLEEFVKLKEKHHEESKGLHLSLNRIRKQLHDLDHEGAVKRTKYLSKPWGFFWSPCATCDMESLHSRYTVEILDTTGYNKKYLKHEIQESRLEDGRAKIQVKLEVPHIFTRLEATVTVSSNSCLVHGKQISQLKGQEKALKGQLRELEGKQTKEEEQKSCNQKHAASIKQKLGDAEKMRRFLESEWSMRDYRLFRRFYMESCGPDKDLGTMADRFKELWRRYIDSEDSFRTMPPNWQVPKPTNNQVPID